MDEGLLREVSPAYCSCDSASEHLGASLQSLQTPRTPNPTKGLFEGALDRTVDQPAGLAAWDHPVFPALGVSLSTPGMEATFLGGQK